jgi:hypothetical protein
MDVDFWRRTQVHECGGKPATNRVSYDTALSGGNFNLFQFIVHYLHHKSLQCELTIGLKKVIVIPNLSVAICTQGSSSQSRTWAPSNILITVILVSEVLPPVTISPGCLSCCTSPVRTAARRRLHATHWVVMCLPRAVVHTLLRDVTPPSPVEPTASVFRVEV